MTTTLLLDVALADRRVDLRVDDGVITAIAPAGTLPVPRDVDVRRGGLVTAPLAEPHVHLDAALLAEDPRHHNTKGTLREGIAVWARARDTLTADDLEARARRAVGMYRSWGCTRLRTHVDTGSLLAVEVLTGLRDSLGADGVELQVVAFPQEGILRAPGRRQAWEDAVALGVDAVGAIPHFERTREEGWESVRLAFALAERRGLLVDLHCDETDDPGSNNLEVVCAETIDRGFAGRVVAGHCTALHSYPAPHRAKVVELVAEAGVQVVTNPLDNVVLQGRYDRYPRRRGNAPVDELWDAGAAVGIGHDSVRDPWYPLGQGNLVDAAYMLVHVAQLTSPALLARTFGALHGDNHLPFGGSPPIEVGAPARLLHWPCATAVEALRDRPRPTAI